MKWVLFVVLFVVVIGGAVAAFFPMSWAAGFLASKQRDFQYGKASGSVWDGKLTQVRFGDQVIGDVKVKTDAMKLIGGKAAGRFGLTRPEYAGEGMLSYDIRAGKMQISRVKMSGKMLAVRGLPDKIRKSDGQFTVVIDEMTLGREACETASGEVWTDALARVDMEERWTGPELRGPVSCKDGHVVVEAVGKALTGEDVTARVDVGRHLDLNLEARVDGVSPGAQEALVQAGFRPDGAALRLSRQIGGDAAPGS